MGMNDWLITCDMEGCRNSIDLSLLAGNSGLALAKALKKARKKGWIVAKGNAICPKHKKEGVDSNEPGKDNVPGSNSIRG